MNTNAFVYRTCSHVSLSHREMDWLFNSHEGRRQLADNAKFQRLLVIHLGRDHRFESLDCIQNELSGVVSSLQPADLPPNTRVIALLISGLNHVLIITVSC